MRTRTAVASAVLVLCVVLGSAACSASSESTPSTGSSTSAEKKSSQQQSGRGKPEVDPSKCATSADKMPKGCEVDVDVSEISEGTPDTEGPSTK
ncbi:hypothetical protein [Streptomyces sp. NPDC102360]|uniref:hypothetical protein n=1 Tax=Streptomyces sp. NPDC102360 TaxID=3366160 RepID=UPI0037F299EC